MTIIVLSCLASCLLAIVLGGCKLRTVYRAWWEPVVACLVFISVMFGIYGVRAAMNHRPGVPSELMDTERRALDIIQACSHEPEFDAEYARFAELFSGLIDGKRVPTADSAAELDALAQKVDPPHSVSWMRIAAQKEMATVSGELKQDAAWTPATLVFIALSAGGLIWLVAAGIRRDGYITLAPMFVARLTLAPLLLMVGMLSLLGLASSLKSRDRGVFVAGEVVKTRDWGSAVGFGLVGALVAFFANCSVTGPLERRGPRWL